MSKTESFGLAYKVKPLQKNETLIEPIFDVHINFWHVSTKESPFIDFGIKITDYKHVQKITFSAPFPVSVKEIFDLSYVLTSNETQLIFSDLTYKFETIPKKYSLISNDSETIVFLPIKCDLNGENFFTGVETNDSNEQNFNITIDMTQYKALPNASSIYFRFRIKNEAILGKFLHKLQEKNYYLESAFVERQIIDIKFNDARNIDRSEFTRVESENCIYAKFKSIHLFLMVPSSYEVTIWDNFSECRQLEDGWDNYLLNNIDSKKIDNKNILVYHWKKKAYRKNYFDKFTQLIRIELKDTNLKLIIYYCFIVVLLGAIGSGLATFIPNLLI